MGITKAERQRIVRDVKRKEKEKLRKRMAKLGKIMTPKKRAANLISLKKARQVYMQKYYPGMEREG